MSRNEKQLKEIIKTLGGTYSENDNCTCELLGRVNEALSIKTVTELPSEIIDEKVIYRLVDKKIKWKGTPVNNKTTRIYFNTNLSADEVNKIMSDVCVEYGSEYYDIIKDRDGNHNIALDCNYAMLSDSIWGEDYFKNGEWLLTDTNYIDIDDTWTNGILIGEHNDVISSLISSTPFEPIYTPYCRDLYVYDNGWCKFVKESPVKVIDLLYYNGLTINLTENGKYFLEGFDTIPDKVTARFGFCKNYPTIGKFIHDVGVWGIDQLYAGLMEESTVVFRDDDRIKCVLIEVTDDSVNIYGRYEI